MNNDEKKLKSSVELFKLKQVLQNASYLSVLFLILRWYDKNEDSRSKKMKNFHAKCVDYYMFFKVKIFYEVF